MTTSPPRAPRLVTSSRRQLLGAPVVLAAASLGVAAAAQAPPRRRGGDPIVAPAVHRWPSVPAQAPATQHRIDVGGARLSAWDTGGRGEVVVLLHPATGSAAIWGYQQPELTRAGYRVIAYSRRGHGESEPGSETDTTPAIDDLTKVLAALKVDRFHVVGFAAGGFIVPDFALSHPGRLLSMTLACTQGGVIDPEYRKRISDCTPPPFGQMPASFRELGPSYRAGNREGTLAWEALEKAAVPGRRVPLRTKNSLTWAAIESINTPALVVGGAADLYMPATLALDYASHLRNVETAILSECGHSGYWEQPAAFNRLMLDFLGRNRAARPRRP